MAVIVAFKNEEDPIRIEGAGAFTTSFPLQVYGDFFKRSRAVNSAFHGWILPNFEHIRDLMAVLVTWKNEQDLIKNVGATVFTTINSHFPNAQGQATPQSMVESCWISNSSEISWLSLLPARMKKIWSEMKALECSHNIFPIVSLWGFFQTLKGS